MWELHTLGGYVLLLVLVVVVMVVLVVLYSMVLPR